MVAVTGLVLHFIGAFDLLLLMVGATEDSFCSYPGQLETPCCGY